MLKRFLEKPTAWVDYGLTLPVFLAYHVGVVFLGGVRNATDLVTPWILSLTGDKWLYFGLVLAMALVFSVGSALAARKEKSHALEASKFVQVLVEGAVYAFVLRTVAALVVGTVFGAGILRKSSGLFADVVLSLGAGFYEELAFRVILYGVGANLILRWLLSGEARTKDNTVRHAWTATLLRLSWMVIVSLLFSAVHYIGPFADNLDALSFTFRFVLGMLLTVVYLARGFGVVVWTHALYDLFIVLHL